MSRGIRLLTLCGLLTACAPARAVAEWQLAPFVGLAFAGDTNLILTEVERHWNFGGTARLVGAGPLGVETVFLYVPGAFRSLELVPISLPADETINKSRSIALMGNLVLTTPRTWNEYGLRPYVSGGFGLMHAWHDDAVALPEPANVPAYNVGGGAVGFLTERVGLRFDLRFFRTLPPGKEPDVTTLITTDSRRLRIRYWTGTVGVVFKY